MRSPGSPWLPATSLSAALVTLTVLGQVQAAQAPEPARINGQVVPPSPADPYHHPGLRRYDLPRFTHWPGIIYDDEQRNLAFHVPVPPRDHPRHPAAPKRSEATATTADQPEVEELPKPPHDPRHYPGWYAGDAGTIAWIDAAGKAVNPLPVQLPNDKEIKRVSGLLDLPKGLGSHTAILRIAQGRHNMAVRLVGVDGAWPIHGLVNGFPVDADGVPVVLVTRRQDPDAKRRWKALQQRPARPKGPVLLIGDPLAGPGGDCWQGLAESGIQCQVATDDRFAHHAALPALRSWSESLNTAGVQQARTLAWSPGNEPLHNGSWTKEEGRLLGLVRERCRSAGYLPRLLLILPPLPIDEKLQARAEERRRYLRGRAAYHDWEVWDAQQALAGLSATHELAPGLTTRYPYGAAREAIRKGLVTALAE